jgi:hypothetical protein
MDPSSPDPFTACVGKSRSLWLKGVVDKLKVGARLLILGNRRNGKTTIVDRLGSLKGIDARDTFTLSAFSVDPHATEKFEIFCKGPFHHKLKLAVVDDIDCFSGADLKVIRRCLRAYERLCFVITTSTISGLNEAIVSQCNIVHLLPPQKKDIDTIVGASPDNGYPSGISIGAALNIKTANTLIGTAAPWNVRCSADAIIEASIDPTPEKLYTAVLEVRELTRNGWTCGDVIETLHMTLSDKRWAPQLELHIAKILLKYATLADRPDASSLLLYTLAVELAAATHAVAAPARCFRE